MSHAALAVDGLVKRYDGRTVLDGVGFAIANGELVALLGPNGAGKTTTIEILEGYRRADGGRVEVLGADPLTGGPALRARVGLMLQGGGGIDPRTTPGEAVRLFARFHEPARDPDELLDLVGLRPVARTRFRRLSGGERQRLALALALVGEPELLLLDEPTAGMDPAARAATRSLIRDLRAGGVTILLTTHDLGDVEALADRVLVLDGGRLVADGPPGSIGAPSGDRVLRLRTSVPVEPSALAATLRPRWPGVVVAPAGTHVAVRAVEPTPGLIAAVASWCLERDLLVVELTVGGGSLEERYLALTGDTSVEHGA